MQLYIGPNTSANITSVPVLESVEYRYGKYVGGGMRGCVYIYKHVYWIHE